MDSRRQEMLGTEGITILVRDWRVSGEPSGSDHRQIRYALYQIRIEEEWTGYMAARECQLRNAPEHISLQRRSRIASQFISDATEESLIRTALLRGRTPRLVFLGVTKRSGLKWESYLIWLVFIPKPGRIGHMYAKEFRPTRLTFLLLRAPERLVYRFLKTGPLVKHPLAASQYAYRESRSIETALHPLVSS